MDIASAAEMVDLGSIPCWVKLKTIKVDVHRLPV